MTMVGESSCTTNKVYKILMNILPALIAHLIHNEKLDLSLSVVAIGLIGAGNLICSLGPTYFYSVGLSILNELMLQV